MINKLVSTCVQQSSLLVSYICLVAPVQKLKKKLTLDMSFEVKVKLYIWFSAPKLFCEEKPRLYISSNTEVLRAGYLLTVQTHRAVQHRAIPCVDVSSLQELAYIHQAALLSPLHWEHPLSV